MHMKGMNIFVRLSVFCFCLFAENYFVWRSGRTDGAALAGRRYQDSLRGWVAMETARVDSIVNNRLSHQAFVVPLDTLTIDSNSVWVPILRYLDSITTPPKHKAGKMKKGHSPPQQAPLDSSLFGSLHV